MVAVVNIKVNIRDRLRPRGHVKATIRNLDQEIIDVVYGRNLVTDAGEELFMEWMNGEAPDYITYCAVGSDNTPPVEGDVTLGTEIDRLLITDQSRAGTTITYSTFFAVGDANGIWEEEGLLNAAVGGTLVSHTLFAATITKDITKTVTVDHQLIMAGS